VFETRQSDLDRQLKDAVYRWDAQKVTALLAVGAELRAMDDDALRWALMAEPWGRTADQHKSLKRMLEQELASRVVLPFKPRIRRQDRQVE
jgi:hypothetical protein